MTQQQDHVRHATTTPTGDAATAARALGLVPVALIACGAFALRLPYLGAPLTSDEGGFLTVARGWHAGGASLYGDHWVDRPPLLLALYKAAVELGGLTPLRLLGAAAVAATVFLVGATAARLVGRRAGLCAAGIAAALLVSPLLGTVAANGELLAAPIVALGVGAVMWSHTTTRSAHARGGALLAGLAAASAVMVKQNMVDVVVFAVVLAVVSWRNGGRPVVSRREGTAWFVGGIVTGSALVLGAASALGSHPTDVLYAMYPFRVRAAAVMTYVPWDVRLSRIGHLAEAYAVSLGILLVLALATAVLLRRVERRVRPAAIATLALAAYAVTSILAGGSYWTHYLVELVVPTALAGGIALSGVRPTRWVRPVAGAVIVGGAVGWLLGLHVRVDATGQTVGRAIGSVAEPGDSVVSLLGDGALVEASGLPASYPYLWSLPSRTFDPRLTVLAGQMSGPRPPTWVVVRGAATQSYVDQRVTGPLLEDGYRRAGVVCGRTVYLLRGVQRPPLPASSTCRVPLTDLD